MTNRPRSKTYDVLAVSSTVHKANADYLAGILRYASGRQDWRLWLFNPLADYSYGNVLPARRASGVIVNGIDEVPLESLRPRNRRACVVISDCATDSGVSSVLCDNASVARAAADFFLSRQFRNFAFAEAPLSEAFSVERLDAFAAAVRPDNVQAVSCAYGHAPCTVAVVSQTSRRLTVALSGVETDSELWIVADVQDRADDVLGWNEYVKVADIVRGQTAAIVSLPEAWREQALKLRCILHSKEASRWSISRRMRWCRMRERSPQARWSSWARASSPSPRRSVPCRDL